MPFIIEVSDKAVMAALNRVRDACNDMSPILQSIGEGIMERTKQRFDTSTGPDGQPWLPNSPVTLAHYIQTRGGKNFRKDGRVNKRGMTLLAGKKPLIGEGGGGSLSEQFHVSATNNSVTVGSSMIYAAMQQFGGKRSDYENLWGDIPARPFLPVTANEELYPEDRDLIVEELQRYILDACRS